MSENNNRNGYEIRQGLLQQWLNGILGRAECSYREFENEMVKPELVSEMLLLLIRASY